jgi:hypothetical protein
MQAPELDLPRQHRRMSDRKAGLIATVCALTIVAAALVANVLIHGGFNEPKTVTIHAAACDTFTTTKAMDAGSHFTVRIPNAFVMFPAKLGFYPNVKRYDIYDFTVIDHGHHTYTLKSFRPATSPSEFTDYRSNGSAC